MGEHLDKEIPARKQDVGSMSWRSGVEELNCRQAMTAAMGGDEKLVQRRGAGKLNVRERIAALQ